MFSRIERDNGLVIEKVRVPLGVVAVIYEARPNVTTDAAALTLKSGNACILRGSRMAANTNRVLIDLVRSAIEASGLPIDSVQEMEADRERLREFIARPGAADVVIPRGGEELKHFLLDNSRIPVLAAAGGNNHVYVDATPMPPWPRRSPSTQRFSARACATPPRRCSSTATGPS